MTLINALNNLDGLAHHMPLIRAMTTRNFPGVVEGKRLEPGSYETTEWSSEA